MASTVEGMGLKKILSLEENKERSRCVIPPGDPRATTQEGGGSVLGSRTHGSWPGLLLDPPWPGSWGPLGLAPTLPPPLSSADGSRCGHRQL